VKPRVLIFTDWYLPGFRAGGPVTSIRNLVNGLKADYDFYILTTNKDYKSSLPYTGVEYDKWIKKEDHLHVCYVSGKSWRHIRRMATEIDDAAWYMTGLYSWYFSIMPVIYSRRLRDSVVIVAPRGMLSSHAIDIKPAKKLMFLFLSKIFGIYQNVRFQATSETEKDDIQNIFRANRVDLVPNLPYQSSLNKPESIEKSPGVMKLICLGRIAPEKNTLGALEILKQYTESDLFTQGVTIKYQLFGQVYNDNYFRECKRVSDELPAEIVVEFNEAVSPDELMLELRSSHFLFLPTNGENFGHAIAESLAEGRPVIISDNTPWKDLERKGIGWNIDLVNTQKFVQILHLCLQMNQDQYDKYSVSSFNFMKQFQDASDSKELYRKLFSK